MEYTPIGEQTNEGRKEERRNEKEKKEKRI